MRRNANRKVYNDRKNVSATPFLNTFVFDINERLQFLHDGVAVGVHGHDGPALTESADTANSRQDNAMSTDARLHHAASACQHPEDVLRRVCGVGLRFLPAVEGGRGEAVPLVVGPVVRLRSTQAAVPTVRLHRLAELRQLVAFVLDLVRVPRRQRSHEDDLQRDGVAPALGRRVALGAVSLSRAVVLHRVFGHLPVGCHRHEDVLVGEAAVLVIPAHGVLLRLAVQAVIVGGIQSTLSGLTSGLVLQCGEAE